MGLRYARVASRGDYDDVVAVEKVEGTVDVALEVDADAFLELFLRRLGLRETAS